MTYSSSKRGEDDFAQADQDTIRLLKQRLGSEEPPSDEIRLDEKPSDARTDRSEDAGRR